MSKKGGWGKLCKYCNEDRLINQGAVFFGEKGKIAFINSEDEFVVNIDGNQMNIPIKYCPFCNEVLKETNQLLGSEMDYER
ncbi:hypothetical protein D3C81_08740 [compost metagenome]